MYDKLEASLQGIAAELGAKPRAVLSVSGHWETAEFAVMGGKEPGMVYDYSGFPPFTYTIRYPAPGAPEVAARVQELLPGTRLDFEQGFDHGTFAPLAVMYPEADVPILQLSIRRDYDVEAHLQVGRALRALREEGVLILGSGLSYHNLRMLGPAGAKPSSEFDTWLGETLCGNVGAARNQRLRDWERAPSARVAHPREDHLIPLMVAVGAAEEEAAKRVYFEDTFFGAITASSYRFGAA
jgi:aromatic ring-opening dioxygenase catalytic subunit (LigB family)